MFPILKDFELPDKEFKSCNPNYTIGVKSQIVEKLTSFIPKDPLGIIWTYLEFKLESSGVKLDPRTIWWELILWDETIISYTHETDGNDEIFFILIDNKIIVDFIFSKSNDVISITHYGKEAQTVNIRMIDKIKSMVLTSNGLDFDIKTNIGSLVMKSNLMKWVGNPIAF